MPGKYLTGPNGLRYEIERDERYLRKNNKIILENQGNPRMIIKYEKINEILKNRMKINKACLEAIVTGKSTWNT